MAMIHQLIFAAPKPGMTVPEFQDYWINQHAVKYASKIPQIKRYCVDRIIPLSADDEPLWNGIAEIWLRPEDQIPSLQSPEFLEGARPDEPRWAAFWKTIVLDTNAVEVLPPGEGADRPGFKLVILVKRRAGLPLEDFRRYSRDKHATYALAVPGLKGYLQQNTVDGAYSVGEALLDGAYQLFFSSEDELRAALQSSEYANLVSDLETFTEPRYIHTFIAQEHWIIGPPARE